MPYKIVTRDDKHCIVKEDDPDGKEFGCHATEKEAQDQMAAMMANEPEHKCTGCVSLKSLTDDTAVLAGWGVRFGGLDLTGDEFTRETDLSLDLVPIKPVFYDHAQTSVKHTLGKIITQELKDEGLWVEAELDRHKAYVSAVLELVKQGALGWSSASIPHLVEREGKSLKRWPIVEFSLTPTPAEPRTLGVERIKALALEFPEFKAFLQDDEPKANAQADSAKANAASPTQNANQNVNKQESVKMDEKEIKALTDSQAALTESVKTLTAELATVKEALKKEPVATPGLVVQPEQKDSYKSICPQAPFGKFLQDVRTLALQGITSPQLKAVLGQNEGISSEGGFLVRTEQTAEIEKKMFDQGLLLSRCDVRAIAAGANSVDFYGRDEDSRANGSRYGGVTAYRVAEAGTITASGAMKWYKYTLKPKGYAAVIYATGDVLQDAALLESEIMDALPAELAFMIDDDIMNGLGVAGCLGILASSALVSVAKETGQAATTFVFENALKMWARMGARGRANSVWFINQDVEPQLYSMSLAVGTGGVPVFMPPSGASGSPYATLFGRPVIPTEFNATLGTVGDVVLADLSQYRVATKGDLQAARSIHVQFLTDQECFRFIKKADGQSKWKNALTPYKGTANTQSPFVAVATRA